MCFRVKYIAATVLLIVVILDYGAAPASAGKAAIHGQSLNSGVKSGEVVEASTNLPVAAAQPSPSASSHEFTGKSGAAHQPQADALSSSENDAGTNEEATSPAVPSSTGGPTAFESNGKWAAAKADLAKVLSGKGGHREAEKSGSDGNTPAEANNPLSNGTSVNLESLKQIRVPSPFRKLFAAKMAGAGIPVVLGKSGEILLKNAVAQATNNATIVVTATPPAPNSLAAFVKALEAQGSQPGKVCACAPLEGYVSISQYPNRKRGSFTVASVSSETNCAETISCKVRSGFAPQFLFAFQQTVLNNEVPIIGQADAAVLQEVQCGDDGEWKIKEGGVFDSLLCFYDGNQTSSIPPNTETIRQISDEINKINNDASRRPVAAGVQTSAGEEIIPLESSSATKAGCPCSSLASLDQSANVNRALTAGTAAVTLSVVAKCETKAVITCTVGSGLTAILRFGFEEQSSSGERVAKGVGNELVDHVTCNPDTGHWHRVNKDETIFDQFACFTSEDDEEEKEHTTQASVSDINQGSKSEGTLTFEKGFDQRPKALGEPLTAASQPSSCPCLPIANLESMLSDASGAPGMIQTFNSTENGCESLAIITCSVASGHKPQLSFLSNGDEAGGNNIGHADQSALEPVNCNPGTGRWQRTTRNNLPFDKFACLTVKEEESPVTHTPDLPQLIRVGQNVPIASLTEAKAPTRADKSCTCGSFASLASPPKDAGQISGIYSITPLSDSNSCSAPMTLSCTAPPGFSPQLLLIRNVLNADQKVIQAQIEGEASEKFSCQDGVWNSKSFGSIDSFTCFYECPCSPMASFNKPGSGDELTRGGEVDIVATAAFGCEKEAKIRCTVTDGHVPVLSYRLQDAKAGENTVGFLRDVEDFATCDSATGAWLRTYDNRRPFNEFSCFAQRAESSSATSTVSSVASTAEESAVVPRKFLPSACLKDQSDVSYTLKKVIQFPEGDKTVTLYEIEFKNNGATDICGGSLVYYIHLQGQTIKDGYDLIPDGSFEVFPPRLIKNEGQYKTPDFFNIPAGKASEKKIGLYVYGNSSDPPVVCTVSLMAKNC